MASGVRLYMAGTIAVENGDDSGPNGGSIVTGTLTLWVGNALAGSPVRMPDGQIYFVIVDAEANTEMEIYPPYEGTTVASGGIYILSRYTDRLAASALQTVRTKELHDKLQTFFGGEGDPDPLLGNPGSVYIQRDGNDLEGARVKDESGWGPLLSPELSPELEAFGVLIEGYKDDAIDAASAAAASVTTAAGHVTTAAGHVTTASGHASAASTSATAASTSQTAAATSATGSASSATAAAASQTAAATSATNAAASATNAATSATTATTQAGTATTQATAAASSAGAAAASASAAAASATAADTSADAADASADAAAASAALAAMVAKFTTTSTSSVAIGPGAKTFTAEAGVQYVRGQKLRIVSDASAANFMVGNVTSYSGTTLVMDIEDLGGSGTHADWTISLTGEKGADGDGAVNTVNGIPSVSGDVTLTASDIEIDSLTPSGYTPAGTSIEQHLSGISAALLSAGINSNHLVNGDGLFNTNPFTAAADTDAIVDHWRALTQSAEVSFSVQNDVANGVPNLIRLSQANASAQRMGAAQTIEASASKLLRGRNVTLSGKVKLSTSATVRFAVLAWTGTADSAPADVVNDWTSGAYTTGNFFTSTTMSLIAEGSLAVTGNALTDITLSGAAPSGTNNIIVLFWTSATVIQNVTLDFRAKLETGNVATAWAPLDPALEYARTDDLARRVLIGVVGAARGGNLAVNGFQQISQESGDTAVGNGGYPCDQNVFLRSHTATATAKRVSTPFSSRLDIPRGIEIEVTSGASTSAGNYLALAERIEGERSQRGRLVFGGAAAKPLRIGRVLRSNVSGRGYASIQNSAQNRSYIKAFDLVANTDTWVDLTIPGDTSGTWPQDTSVGLSIQWTFSCGSTYHGTANAWNASNVFAASDITNFAATTGNKIWLGPMVVMAGLELPTFAEVMGCQRHLDDELRACQKYFEKSYDIDTNPASITNLGVATALGLNSTNRPIFDIPFMSTKRSPSPTITYYSPATGATGKCLDINTSADVDIANQAVGPRGFSPYIAATPATNNLLFIHWTANARM